MVCRDVGDCTADFGDGERFLYSLSVLFLGLEGES